MTTQTLKCVDCGKEFEGEVDEAMCGNCYDRWVKEVEKQETPCLYCGQVPDFCECLAE
jgi:DNA-directed RNA polymerase subunit RPC12/RpoP